MIKNIKENMPLLYKLFYTGNIIIILLSFISILEDKSLLPQDVFRTVYIISLVIYTFLCILLFLINILQPLYIDAQIKYFKMARHSIYLSIHSVNSESNNTKYKIFNQTIENANRKRVDVKILAPCSIDRIYGAYEMCEKYRLKNHMRFNAHLEDESLRYTLIDDSIVLISYQSIPSKKLSRKFVCIKSVRLNKLLKNYFMEMWSGEDTLHFNQFLKNILYQLQVTESDFSSISRATEFIKIPEDYLSNFLKEEEA